MIGHVQVDNGMDLSTPEAIKNALSAIGEWCTSHQSLCIEVDHLEEFVSVLVPRHAENSSAWPAKSWFTDMTERLEMRIAHAMVVNDQDDSMLRLAQRLRTAIPVCYKPPKLPIPGMAELWHLIPDLVTTPTQLLFILESLKGMCKAYEQGLEEAVELGDIISQLEQNRQLAKPSQRELEKLLSLHERLNALRRQMHYSGGGGNTYELFLSLIISSVRIYSLRGWWTAKDTETT